MMTIARHYVMIAKPDQGSALFETLTKLAEHVKVVEGCEGVELFRDVENARRFIFVERWTSIEAHKTGGKQLPKTAFAPVMAALDQPPEGAYLELLHSL